MTNSNYEWKPVLNTSGQYTSVDMSPKRSIYIKRSNIIVFLYITHRYTSNISADMLNKHIIHVVRLCSIQYHTGSCKTIIQSYTVGTSIKPLLTIMCFPRKKS